ncbi:hypothetical protein DLAC_11657 [Tieghemostelium lacteum]|uniref:Rhodanese domain-containing protein n=1 Tax=Tieghemostelium lacteum TaxID=361077 RepID=A0A151ZFB8_TIELA|nr:hypothetical protein DLAC_11657 [Tieghemostelium lacteum]|eukprot:KYQ92564.1 hypothetical protein DLAC_11657 [Tieghemostelium lacteum]
MFRLITNSLKSNGLVNQLYKSSNILSNNTLINNSSKSLLFCKSYTTNTTTTTTTTTITEPIYQNIPGVAGPTKKPTPKKVPKRRPGKVRSIEYKQYASIPRLAGKGLFRITKMGFDYYLIDVRDPEQFKTESIIGSVNHPVSTIEQTSEPMDRNTMVLVMGQKERGWVQQCEAALKLQQKGFKNVIVLEVGPQEMVDLGFFYTSEKDFAQ